MIDRTPLPGYVHPSETAYLGGCRCDPCAFRRYRVRKRHKIRSAKGPVMVPAAPARLVLEGLINEGYTKNLIMRVSGIDEHVIRRILAGGVQVDRDRLTRITLLTRQVILERAPDDAQVPVIGSQRRLQALMRMGWSQHHLAGDDPSFLRVLTDICAGSRKRVTVETHRRIAALYGQLSMTPGPSRIALYRRVKGFSPPLAWDDDTIDDPTAKPNLDGFPDQDLRNRLYEEGASDAEIARETGVSPESVRRWRKRHGLESNYAPRGRTA